MLALDRRAGAVLVLGFVMVMNAYEQPQTGDGHGHPDPGPDPDRRRRSSCRSSHASTASGATSSPSAAARRAPSSPASTPRRITVQVFALMGLLCGLASIVITARLNAGASVTGTMTELNVIAAAVIGGTSLAGGIGTIYGGIARRADHAEPGKRHDPDGRAHARAEDGAGGRPDPGGLARHGLAPAARRMTAAPLDRDARRSPRPSAACTRSSA